MSRSRAVQINFTTAVILIVVSWLSCAPVLGFPAASRAASGESMSARRRGGDGLIAGSDFLNMFIGAKVDPTVRSRRFPLVRADLVEPAQDHGPETTLSPSSDQVRRRNNDLTERLSGLIRSQDRYNYHLENQDQHNTNNVEHVDDVPRRGVTKFNKNLKPRNRLSEDGVTEDAVIRGVMASESQVFGGRTLPRTSSNPPSTGATSEHPPTSDAVTEYRASTTETEDLPEDATETEREGHTQTTHIDVTDEDEINSNSAGHSKYSISSSVQRVIAKENDRFGSEALQKNEIPMLNDKAEYTSTDYQTVTDIVTSKDTLSTQDDVTLDSVSTESSDVTTEGESTTTTTTTAFDSELPTEKDDDWSTRLDVTSEPTVTAEVEEIPDVAQFQKVGHNEDRHETAVQVVSVRVSSSVAQAPQVSQSRNKGPTLKKNSIFNTIPEEPSRDAQSSGKTRSNSVSLETVELPPTTSLQRSELLVEESSPSEVTADPNTSYASFLSSNFPSPSTNYYHRPSEQTPSAPLNYQSALANQRRRAQFFNHPPTTYRNPTIEALRRSSDDSPSHLNGFVKATIENISPRRYAAHSLLRNQDSFHTLRKEPASVAESIQRSIIASQEPDRSDARSGLIRSQFHQDKNRLPAGTYAIGDPARDKKIYHGESYSEPERVWGEPEKVYGEPEKVYGEPEKVYGEPEKVYGEPAKNYEVDEAVSVMTNGRAHGIQPSPVPTQPPAQTDSPLRMLDSKQQDPNHKFGYVVEGRNFRKYRVEERTSDGFIVGEYGVVSHDDGSLRGVRYTADDSINPRLIYDTLVKFLSL